MLTNLCTCGAEWAGTYWAKTKRDMCLLADVSSLHVDSIVSSPLLSYFNPTVPGAGNAAPDSPLSFLTLSNPS